MISKKIFYHYDEYYQRYDKRKMGNIHFISLVTIEILELQSCRRLQVNICTYEMKFKRLCICKKYAYETKRGITSYKQEISTLRWNKATNVTILPASTISYSFRIIKLRAQHTSKKLNVWIAMNKNNWICRFEKKKKNCFWTCPSVTHWKESNLNNVKSFVSVLIKKMFYWFIKILKSDFLTRIL